MPSLSSYRYRSLILALTSLAFVLALWCPPLRILMSPQKTISETEKRRLADFPPLPSDLRSLRSFSSDFEAFYNDHFGFREPMIRWHNYLKYRWLGISPTARVLIGRGGWLYTTDYGALEDTIGAARLNPSQIEAWRRILTDRRDWLAERGVHYLFVVAPNKHTIYPENLPRHLRRASGRTRMDQFSAYFAAHSDLQPLDLRPDLAEAKRRGRVYLQTDTHWNRQGAYVAYQAIMQRLAARLPDVRILQEADLRRGEFEGQVGDLAHILNLGRHTPREQVPYIRLRRACARSWKVDTTGWDRRPMVRPPRATICPDGGATAVVFHDSFGDWLVPFWAESFARVIFVNRSYDHDIMASLMEQVRPDLVIEQRVERLLGRVPRPLLGDETVNGSRPPRFKAAGRRLVQMNPRSGFRGLSPGSQLTLRPSAEGLYLYARGADPSFRLDLALGAEPGEVLIQVVITSPAETTFQVYYADRRGVFSESCSRERTLRAGRNSGIIRLPAAAGALRLRLDPGKVPGTYLLENLDIRWAAKEPG